MRGYLTKNKSKFKMLLLVVLVLLAGGTVFVINGVGRSKASGFEDVDYWIKLNKDTVLLDSNDPINSKVVCNIKKGDTLYVYSIRDASSTGASSRQYWYYVRYCGESNNKYHYGNEGFVLVDASNVGIQAQWSGSVRNVLTDVTGYYQYQGTKLSNGNTLGYNWCGAASTKSVVQHFTQSDTIRNYAKSYGIEYSGAASEFQIRDKINSYSSITNGQTYSATRDSNKRVLMDKLRQSIYDGNPAIVLVQVNDSNKSGWGYTTGGHYVTVSGYNDETGKVTICDSVGSKRVREVSIGLLADCLKMKHSTYDYFTIIYGEDK